MSGLPKPDWQHTKSKKWVRLERQKSRTQRTYKQVRLQNRENQGADDSKMMAGKITKGHARTQVKNGSRDRAWGNPLATWRSKSKAKIIFPVDAYAQSEKYCVKLWLTGQRLCVRQLGYVNAGFRLASAKKLTCIALGLLEQ